MEITADSYTKGKMANHLNRILYFILLSVFALNSLAPAQTPTGIISGQVTNQTTGKPLPDCNISAASLGVGTVSDSLGLYLLRLPVGDYTIEFSHLGFQAVVKEITLPANRPRLRLDIKMMPVVLEGKSVTVLEERQIGSLTVQELQRADIRNMPTLYSDVFRTVKILPGVSSNNELSSAYNVRGGNFDENLIYLNGYEIYRPFLLRQGQEENQSLINPDMVQDLRFYGGAFPVSLGDKLSSALEVNYQSDYGTGFGGSGRADLLNAGVSLHGGSEKLRWIGGLRYANPELFISRLQTEGSYRPLFADAQLLLNYQISPKSALVLFVLQAYNRFNLTPENWMGNFKFSLFDIKAVEIEYQGERKYSFTTGLIGLRFNHEFTRDSRLSVSLARYATDEAENTDLQGEIFYVEDANNPERGREYLKSRIERAGNSLELQAYELQSVYRYRFKHHGLRAGLNLRLTRLKNNLDEYFVEKGDSSTRETPRIARENQQLNFTYISGYVQDILAINRKLEANFGLRFFHYDYNRETLVSPRASLQYFPDPRNTLSISGGLYYQPPFFYELRNKGLNAQPPLKSQKALHVIAGWERRFQKNLKFQAEVYYKNLDQIIPYYLDQLTLVYADRNANEGCAYGLDLLVQGEFIKEMNSWISYSFLRARERETGGASGYQRRLLDQTHTLRIFLQDKIPQHPNIQVHLRMLFGSGYLYHPREPATDPSSGETVLAVNFDRRKKFQSYQRVDLGLSGRIKLGSQWEAVITGEVLNIFNHINVASYSWFQVFPGQPIRVPHIYTRRFFNIGIEVAF